MSQRFNFKAYILSVIDERRLCVRIDKEYLEVVSAKLTTAHDRTTFKDTIAITLNDCDFDIDFTWKELIDLVGIHIKIHASTRRYSYYKTKTTYDENNDVRKSLVQCKGVAISAKKISNKDLN